MKMKSFIYQCLAVIFIAVIFSSCAFRSIRRYKGIEYFRSTTQSGPAPQKLNIFSPRKKGSVKDVLIFIHGGNWNSGKRYLYNFFGSRMARKGVVTVVIDYPLSPKATYKEMALASAAAAKWVKEHIAKYGGDDNNIFISGHSAGGHLASLVSLDDEYFDSLGFTNPIKGTILIDAGGLDMYNYLKEEDFPEGHTYLKTFSNDPNIWKRASPVYYVKKSMPPMLIYQGGKTYPSIREANDRFLDAVLPLAPETKHYIIKEKKHIQMITQFFKPWNPRYKQIIAFMASVKT